MSNLHHLKPRHLRNRKPISLRPGAEFEKGNASDWIGLMLMAIFFLAVALVLS